MSRKNQPGLGSDRDQRNVRRNLIDIEVSMLGTVAISTSGNGTFARARNCFKIYLAKAALALVSGKRLLMTGWLR